MKVGFSFGRCIRDIVNGDVAYEDVAFIITGTALRDEDAINWCISEYLYRRDYLLGLDEECCKKVAIRLYGDGKLFQPRLQNIRAFHIPEVGVWADLFPTALAENESAKKAWESYRFFVHMTSQVPEDGLEGLKS